ncbi:hypothetical protein GCM10010280_67050 [Streptomyces pilosus]|uniref:Uncharacterized protein n=1 Tax=Streptomyces pilosus TaxID=28893 RepID=A0A918C720_9ACTN|nr:hypothetical protein GCM10010280_67050 [Streptomyces pilosus]
MYEGAVSDHMWLFRTAFAKGRGGERRVTGAWDRPCRGHRPTEDSRIALNRKDRERGAATAARSRTAGLPSLVSMSW